VELLSQTLSRSQAEEDKATAKIPQTHKTAHTSRLVHRNRTSHPVSGVELSGKPLLFPPRLQLIEKVINLDTHLYNVIDKSCKLNFYQPPRTPVPVPV
jgi:hypothetical protein